ncbi:TIE1-like protein [Mya arenaria]|uniref:TIE1-like protein n=1 Tax=Mya arenaria TaxID=6604 RepID=A0ABY7F461_MYAAR|nr:TIE1-like protein [Mya arenaria]
MDIGVVSVKTNAGTLIVPYVKAIEDRAAKSVKLAIMATIVEICVVVSVKRVNSGQVVQNVIPDIMMPIVSMIVDITVGNAISSPAVLDADPDISFKMCQGCIDGYFLHQELCEKCPDYCITCVNSTKCTSCADGRFGNTCQFKCTNNCVHGNCVSTNGTCDCNAYYIGETCDQCVAGYFGNECKQKCSTGCSDTCSEADGSCTCKSGWTGGKCETCDDKHYGEMCEQICPKWCKTCENESHCSSCNDGYFGVSCQISCPNGCKGNICKKKTWVVFIMQTWVFRRTL